MDYGTHTLHITLPDRASQVVTLKVHNFPGEESVLVENMTGLNDFDIQSIVESISDDPIAAEALRLVDNCFCDMRAQGLPGTSRMYRDGSW